MPSKKTKTGPAWQVLLEDMHSLNRRTIEAVEVTRQSLEQKIDRIDRETRLRDASLEAGLRDLRAEFGRSRVDVRLSSLEERVTALERRPA